MSQRVLDEREHRRGLVLGLTLAEVLILLLFLLMLALVAQLQKVQGIASTAQADAERYKEIAVKSGAKLPDMAIVKQNAGLAKENAELRTRLDEVGPLIEAARRINPDDPPAATLIVRRALDGLRQEQIKEISQMSPGDRIEITVVRAPAVTTTGSTNKGEHNWPPIITLSDASGYFFEPGSAEPSTEFRVKLTGGVVDQILATIKQYKVDVIEVIGHTDEQPMYSRPPMPPGAARPTSTDIASSTDVVPRPVSRYPNLDSTLIPFLNAREALENVLPFDNAGLGLARAAAVVRVLRDDGRLRPYSILPLSAGQLIESGEKLSAGSPGDVRQRRRIEIRMRRSAR
jgi:flagellar motor protein MotB